MAYSIACQYGLFDSALGAYMMPPSRVYRDTGMTLNLGHTVPTGLQGLFIPYIYLQALFTQR